MDIRELKKSTGRSRSIVEIGHGDLPAFKIFPRIPLIDEVYLGLDIKKDEWKRTYLDYDLTHGRDAIDAARSEGKCCFWDLIGTDGLIPFDDKSVSTIIMVMVSNDRKIDHNIIWRLIEESGRVLEAGGKLIAINGPAGWELGEKGDLYIDFQGRSFGELEYQNSRRAIPGLDRNFQPCSFSEHIEMLRKYDGNPKFIPGVNISIFSSIGQ